MCCCVSAAAVPLQAAHSGSAGHAGISLELLLPAARIPTAAQGSSCRQASSSGGSCASRCQAGGQGGLSSCWWPSFSRVEGGVLWREGKGRQHQVQLRQLQVHGRLQQLQLLAGQGSNGKLGWVEVSKFPAAVFMASAVRKWVRRGAGCALRVWGRVLCGWWVGKGSIDAAWCVLRQYGLRVGDALWQRLSHCGRRRALLPPVLCMLPGM